MSADRRRNFVFTSYDVSIEKQKFLNNLKYQFLIYQKEACPTTGRLHLQGYIELKSAKTVKAMSKYLGGITVLIAKGSAEQNITYCSKDESASEEDGSSFRGGTPKQQGKRNDILDVKRKILCGTPQEKIADLHFSLWCRNYRAFEKYADMKTLKRNWITKVYIYFGDAGTGKSRLAHMLLNDPWIHSDKEWFDGYLGQEDVLFDDFNPDIFPLQRWLTITDRYPCQVPIKGGFRNWSPKRIIFTTNYDPQGWYGGLAQVIRRITEIFNFNKSPCTPPHQKNTELTFF